jgi:penicillin-binding protein 2
VYKRTPIKNHLQEIQLVSQRSIVALVLMLILVILLICRLAYLQLTEHALYTTLSQKNSLDLIPVEPTRGLIYDRNGILLAENLPVFSLDVIPYKAGNLPKALSEIAKLVPLNDTDIVQFQKQLKQHRRFDEIPLKLRLSETEVAKFSENSGFIIKARLIRHYPFDATFSHVLGYVGRINIDELDDIDTTNYSATNYIGKLGIEKYYEDELHGRVGYQQAENDASGEPIRVLNQINPIPGRNLFLTLDSRLQIAVEKFLEGHRGAVVAIQPGTGQVLGYDPNSFVAGISTQDFTQLQNSPDRPLYNRALRGLYPLASTIKPFFALEGLDSGLITPTTTIFDPGWFQLKNSEHIFHDWRRHGHGTVNLNKAIINSCDTYFYELASRMGIGRMDHILGEFGFGELTGIDLDEELPGMVASPAWKRRVKGISWYEGDTIISGIGQGYMQATPLQLANAMSIIANAGDRYTPYLLMGTQEPGKHFVPQPPTAHSKLILSNPNDWALMSNALQGVVNSPEGTGRKLSHAAYTVAAKTGTAQVYSFKKNHYDLEEGEETQDSIPEKLRDHHWLIAYAPADHPQIAIAVLVESSNEATAIARQILDYYLLQLQKFSPNVQTNNTVANELIKSPRTVNTFDIMDTLGNLNALS